jgi:hypothetical protein
VAKSKTQTKPKQTTPPADPVDVIPIGASVRLISVSSLARELHATVDETLSFLQEIDVPVVKIIHDENLYFDLWSLECVLRLVSAPYGPGHPKRGEWPPKSKNMYREAAIHHIIRLMERVGRYYTNRTREALKARCKTLARDIRKQVKIPKSSKISPAPKVSDAP